MSYNLLRLGKRLVSFFVLNVQLSFLSVSPGLYTNTTGLSSWRQPIVINNCAHRYAQNVFLSCQMVHGQPTGQRSRDFLVAGKKDDVDGSVTSEELSSKWKPHIPVSSVYKGKVLHSLNDRAAKCRRQEVGDFYLWAQRLMPSF